VGSREKERRALTPLGRIVQGGVFGGRTVIVSRGVVKFLKEKKKIKKGVKTNDAVLLKGKRESEGRGGREKLPFL